MRKLLIYKKIDVILIYYYYLYVQVWFKCIYSVIFLNNNYKKMLSIKVILFRKIYIIKTKILNYFIL